MYPYIHILIPSYTAMALVGGIIAIGFMYVRLEKFGIPFSTFIFMLFWCMIGGITGSKVLFAATQIPWLIDNLTLENIIWFIPGSGFVYYGGLFGVVATIYILTRREHELRNRIFQLSAPAIPLFHSFGRIGCFMAGCCYGKEMKEPFSLGIFEFTRIPVQLLESIAEILLFVLLLIAERKKRGADLLGIYLLAYAVLRFADEFLRGDGIRGIYFGISTAQWISLAIIAYYTARFLKNRKKKTQLQATDF